MSFMMSILINDVCLLLAVAFFTLLERKILGYIQVRKGPTKVGIFGIFQPFSDALKLFSKERFLLFSMNYWFYIFSPIFSLFLVFSMWVLFPSVNGIFFFFSFGIFFFLCLSSLSVYSTFLAGWASNSKYALLGSLRAVAQTISYEVSMVLVLLSIIFLVGSYNLLFYPIFQDIYFLIFLLCVPLFLVWFVSILAETNRAPFDFAEGESELVSGFNVEYGGGGFALLFLAEYGSILIMSIFSSFFFFLFFGLSFLSFLFGGFISFSFLWVRGSFPRMRYDRLMSLTWKSFLPISLFYLFFSFFVSWTF
uniref:NADH-ubiquinone oxidoreductase chain 1 n=1 Tax=Nectonemertes cf. mirabilis HC-2011 TaxID=992350 RepID=I1SR55_9BILA|nr:NADH dehydrogenase subunit 1 [Nectonemertes cf. mirabilis HC-2011]ADZ05375.1 NADH dehydrogenase subunit 1 [Nectonemertes cf. mirabilis HC-2011]